MTRFSTSATTASRSKRSGPGSDSSCLDDRARHCAGPCDGQLQSGRPLFAADIQQRLYLKERGTKSFGSFKITGWESELMNIERCVPGAVERPAA